MKAGILYYRSQDYYDQAAWRGSWSLDGGGVVVNQGIHMVKSARPEMPLPRI